VPSAVIFDLGNAGKPLGWPSPDDAYRACDNATAEFAEGRVGVGRGATCGKAAGLENMIPAGLGSWAAQFGDVIVAALVVVNAIGDIRNARGEIIAGRVDSLRYLARAARRLATRATESEYHPRRHRHQCRSRPRAAAGAAQSGHDALARRITRTALCSTAT